MDASDQDQYHAGYLAGLVAEARRDRRRLDPSRGKPEGRWWRHGFDDGWTGSDALRDMVARSAGHRPADPAALPAVTEAPR